MWDYAEPTSEQTTPVRIYMLNHQNEKNTNKHVEQRISISTNNVAKH
jgi:hypothetical protein